jgi:UDP-glucose 4-epimerase
MAGGGKRCVVTGGAGFIGSHLVERLLREGHDVAVVDDFSTGSAANLAAASGEGGRLRVHELDVADLDGLRPVVEGADWLFHLAALADIVPSVERPGDYHRANVDGTVSVLEAARDAGVDRLVYAASSSCYGIAGAFPTPESAPIRPEYPYALTKWIGECYVLHWAQVYALPAVSLRLFNVYGPRARTSGTYGAVFGVFLAQKLAGRPYTVVGDGTQTRDFTYVTDVVEAFVAAAASELVGHVLNVGTGRPVAVNRIVELLGADRGVVHLPRRPGEPDRTHADVTRIREALGWEPRVPIEEGVARLLEQIEHWREAPVWDAETIEAATASWFRYLSARA